MPRPVLAVTMGDPGGIGPEVVLKTLSSYQPRNCSVVVFGSPEPFQQLQKKIPLEMDWVRFGEWDLKKSWRGVLWVDIQSGIKIRPSQKGFGFDPGKISKKNAVLAMESLRAATEAAVRGDVQAIVTAPIHKTAMRLLDPNFHGHTEYLAEKARTKSFAMMFVSSRLKVTLATIHEPIRKVAYLITTANVFEKIKLTNDFLKNRFRLKRPKIGVCALNPHGRETGTEDESQIRPAVRKAARMGIYASGPFSADQLFFEAYHGKFDALISMYHDQALAPFKMIAFRDGVNVTLGLPFVRTSPDHGTAFDIAYQGKADAGSFLSAVQLAEKLIRP